MKGHIFLIISMYMVITAFAASQEPSQEVIVTTKSGQLRGVVEQSRNGGTVYAFKGIPFVEPPPRFQLAEPVRPWQGIKNATSYSPVCPQMLAGAVVGEEDCLYLNIFYPSEDRCPHPKLLPVLFYVHGGGFETGSGDTYGYKYLMDECIVYVSFNYRLHVLGFLTMNDQVLPGNLGLKDQLEALKWVRTNIDSFRGNPEEITITGTSAGAISCSLFLFSSPAKGLFDKVILQSGTALAPLALTFYPVQYAQMFGKIMNCTGLSSLELRDCLKSADVRDIVNNYAQVKPYALDLQQFLPTIEPLDAFEPFISEHPYTSYLRGNFHRVPMITGTDIDEGYGNGLVVARMPEFAEDLDKHWHSHAPLFFHYEELDYPGREKDEISDQIREFYIGDTPIGNLSIQNISDIITDRYFYQPSIEVGALHSVHAPVYKYVFTFKGNFSLTSYAFGLDYIVVSHSDDAQYFYQGQNLNDYVPEPDLSTPSGQMSLKYVKLLTSFVKTGVPTDMYGSETAWIPFTDENRAVLILDEDTHHVVNLEKERVAFWDILRLRERYG